MSKRENVLFIPEQKDFAAGTDDGDNCVAVRCLRGRGVVQRYGVGLRKSARAFIERVDFLQPKKTCSNKNNKRDFMSTTVLDLACSRSREKRPTYACVGDTALHSPATASDHNRPIRQHVHPIRRERQQQTPAWLHRERNPPESCTSTQRETGTDQTLSLSSRAIQSNRVAVKRVGQAYAY